MTKLYTATRARNITHIILCKYVHLICLETAITNIHLEGETKAETLQPAQGVLTPSRSEIFNEHLLYAIVGVCTTVRNKTGAVPAFTQLNCGRIEEETIKTKSRCGSLALIGHHIAVAALTTLTV